MKHNLKINNFRYDSQFFFHIPKYIEFIEIDKSKKYLLPTKEELLSLETEIQKYKDLIFTEENREKTNVSILEEYYFPLKNNFKFSNEVNNNYSDRINDILIEFNDKGIKASLKNIKQFYEDKYKNKISIMTISRVLRHKLGYHFLKTTVKNPNLKENNYKFMIAIFIKIILRSIKMGLTFLFIDETGFQLQNNNYYQWRKSDETIIGGAKSDLKNRLNLILAIDDETILASEITYQTVDANIMLNFFKKLEEVISESKKNYIIIMDNAPYHLTSEIKNFASNKKMKVVTNCPYNSSFNVIEYEFLQIKKFIYKDLVKNSNELKQKIIDIMHSNENKKTIKKLYLKGLNIYKNYALQHQNDNLDKLFNEI